MAERDYRREYANLVGTPEKKDKYRVYQREYRRQQRQDPEFAEAERVAKRAAAAADPEKIARWNAEQYDRNRTAFGGRRYGISAEEYAERLTRNCEICGGFNGAKGTNGQHIDHCHETGELRGTLCRKCNIGLGHFFDKPELLIAAAAYINRYSSLGRKNLRRK